MIALADTRRNDLAKIHIARKALALSDADYQALIAKFSQGRTSSAADLDVRERGMLLAHFRKCGFKPAPKRKPQQPYSRTPSAAAPMARKARALWLWGADLGLVRDRSERALNHFAAPLTGASDLSFTDAGHLYNVVEAIKAMIMRTLPDICRTTRRDLDAHLQHLPVGLVRWITEAGFEAAESPKNYEAWYLYHQLLTQAAKTVHSAFRCPVATDVPSQQNAAPTGQI